MDKPKRFHANLVVDNFHKCSGVHFTLFKHRLTETEKAEIPQLIKHPEDIGKSVDANGKVWEGYEPLPKDLVEELFTQEEIDAMRPYFEQFPETMFEFTEMELPIETRDCMGVGAIPVGGPQDFYMFSEAKDYPLPFKVWGYFDLRHTKEWDELPELWVPSQKNPNPEFRNNEDVNYSGGMLCVKCGNFYVGRRQFS